MYCKKMGMVVATIMAALEELRNSSDPKEPIPRIQVLQ
jgi:hypothetical protein